MMEVVGWVVAIRNDEDNDMSTVVDARPTRAEAIARAEEIEKEENDALGFHDGWSVVVSEVTVDV